MTTPAAIEKHPHERAEDSQRMSLPQRDSETPPRTWGRPVDCRAFGEIVRNTPTHVGKTDFRALGRDGWGNTPTHVGKTFPSTVQASCKKKHPHARGEDKWLILKIVMRSETPPRTWGRPCLLHRRREARGNTPTHVGKTELNNGVNNNLEKHPHARGEDSGEQGGRIGKTETPPRTWGRHSLVAHGSLYRRNTPTHVGKTLS